MPKKELKTFAEVHKIVSSTANRIRKSNHIKKSTLGDYWHIGDMLITFIDSIKGTMSGQKALKRLKNEFTAEEKHGLGKSNFQYCLGYRRRYGSAEEFERFFEGLVWSDLVDVAKIHDNRILEYIIEKARSGALSKGRRAVLREIAQLSPDERAKIVSEDRL